MRTNSLTHKADKVYTEDGQQYRIIVQIRLNDECKNGHQDFAITADIHSVKSENKEYWVSGGCQHDEIIKHFPEFKPFVDLHLCDYSGAPMYTVVNGLYHMNENLSDPTTNHKIEFCKHYRVTPTQYEKLSKAETEIEYAMLLNNTGILSRWQKQADRAIKALEKLTGNEFVNDSKRSNFVPPTDEEIDNFRQIEADGYFTPEAKAQRKIDAANTAKRLTIEKATKDAAVKIAEAELERDILILFTTYGVPTDNYILYLHNRELVFNWQRYRKTHTAEQITAALSSIPEPEAKTLSTIKIFTKAGKEKVPIEPNFKCITDGYRIARTTSLKTIIETPSGDYHSAHKRLPKPLRTKATLESRATDRIIKLPKAKQMTCKTYTLPEDAAYYLINADPSALSDERQSEIDEFVNDELKEHESFYVTAPEGEPYESGKNDIDGHSFGKVYQCQVITNFN